MSYSSIYGADVAPNQPSGRDARLLGPSDNSDTGSDAMGTSEAVWRQRRSRHWRARFGQPGDAREDADILPDRVVWLSEGEGGPEEDSDAQDFTTWTTANRAKKRTEGSVR
jgi:hypothetical protein